MFGKLMKHEWRNTAGTQGLLALAALGVGLLAGLVLRTLTQYGDQLPELAIAGITLSLVFMILAMVGCVVAMSILLLVRFYKNKFTDEGYLTFTLPVSSHQIFLSSFLNMLIWSVISGVVLILGFGLFLLIGLSDLQPINQEVIQEILTELKWAFSEMDLGPGYTATFIVQCVVGSVYSVVITMTCITVGAVIAKKHKIIAAFGIYYGISYLTGIFTSIVTLALSLRNIDYWVSSSLPEPDIFSSSIQSMIVMIVWEVILIIAGYILSTQLMKKKLNLP